MANKKIVLKKGLSKQKESQKIEDSIIKFRPFLIFISTTCFKCKQDFDVSIPTNEEGALKFNDIECPNCLTKGVQAYSIEIRREDSEIS